MSNFLPDATDFTDIPLLAKPEGYPQGADTICPLCHGHGKWNLELNAYGSGKHFQGGCGQCWGWGWVTPEDADCIHEFVEISQAKAKALGVMHFGMCWHVIQCTKCGRLRSYDSSD